jgi:hypothetical protein
MTERVIHPMAAPEVEAAAPSPEDRAAAIAQTETFAREVVPQFGRLFGLTIQAQVGSLPEGAGMATTEEGAVIIDPRFFVEAGKGEPEFGEYAILHETAAHLKRIVTNPKLSERMIEFAKPSQPGEPYKPVAERPVDKKRAIFTNILEDVAGNNVIHAVLPRMKGVAKRLYAEKLFDETDYTDIPRHMQFLYKIIRQEMVPDEAVTVLPEVDAAIDGLRDYSGQGDLIKYSTAVAKSAREAMPDEERFDIWSRIIYPVYEDLVEQDRQEPDRQQQSGDGEGEGGDGQTGESQAGDTQQSDNPSQSGGQGEQQPGEGQPQDGQPQSGDGSQGKQTDNQRFGSYYDDYHQNRHPEAMSDESKDKLHDHGKQAQRQEAAKQQTPDQRLREQEKQLDAKVKAETGHSLREQQLYNADVTKWQSAIGEMRDVFQAVINERISQKRGLSRRTFAEGAVLDPDRLVQTVIDVRNHVEQPEAFKDYETKRGETTAIGKTDYIFVFDTSSSMGWDGGNKARAAASSAVIGLEGLAALQRDVEEAEATHKVDLELDIRTAIYTFGTGFACFKPLSTTVTPKERLDTYSAVSSPRGGTEDFLALEDIENLPDESDRRRIMIVVSDGESDDATRARRSVDRLRGKGWFVYGISIGSDEAENLYRPTARRVDDPNAVPETIQTFIEATIS